MKRKMLFTLVAILTVLVLACVVFAACDTVEKGFKVTLDHNKDQGSVTLTKPAEGYLYDAGEQVTVTVEPIAGYEVDSFAVSGYPDASLNGGGYTFEVQADTAVTVTFKKTAYTVSLNSTPADSGTAALDPQKSAYEYGDQVTLTVTCTSDYPAAEVTVAGQPVTLDADGKYKFTVTSNLDISVTFTSQAQILLDSLKGSIVFEGQYVHDDNYYYETTTTDIKTTFDCARKAVLMESYESGAPTAFWLFLDDEGDTLQLTHDMKGELSESAYDFPFKDLDNPFNYIEADQLVKVEDGKWTIKDADVAQHIMDAIFGMSDDYDSFVLTEENGVITKIDIDGTPIVTDYSNDRYIFGAEVKERGTASIDGKYFEDYALTPEHAALKSAMEAAAAATSYTVRYSGEEENYTLYYTPNGIYFDNDNGEDLGYFVRPDGNVWNFYNYVDDDECGFDGVYEGALSDLKAFFTFVDNKGDYYILLESLGNNKFALRAADIYDSYGEVSSFFAMQLATGEGQIDLFQGAQGLTLTLDNGKLSSVEMLVEGYYGYETITLTFSGWDQTSLPYTVPDDMLNGIVEPSYCGTWATERGEDILVVTLDNILFNEEETTSVQKLTDGGYSFAFDGETYTIKQSGNSLTLSASEGAPATLVKCDWVYFIGKFLGVDEDDKDLDIEITASGITVKHEDGDLMTASDIKFEQVYVEDDYGYVEQAYQFTFKLGMDTYILQQYGSGYDTLIYAPKGSQDGLGVTRDRYEELASWSEYLGTYSGEGYQAVLTDDSLTITHDGQSTVISKDDLTFYRDWDYDHLNDYYYHLTFTYDGKSCLFEILDHYMLFIIDSDKPNYTSYYLKDASYEYDLTAFVGNYSDYASAGDSYGLQVTNDGMALTINGAPIGVTLVYVNISYGYSTTLTAYLKTSNGDVYTLSMTISAYGNSIYVYLPNGNDYVFLYAVTEGSAEE